MTEINDTQLWIQYLSEFTPWTRLVHWRLRKQALYPTLIQRPVCLSGFGSGKGSVTTVQLFSFPFVKPVIRAQLHGKFSGRSSGRKEKQNRTRLFTFVLVNHSSLIATHAVFTYTIKKIQLLVFQSILLSSFRNTSVGMNIYHGLTLSCHNPCGKYIKTGFCTSWHNSLASNFVRHKLNSFGVHHEISLSHLNLQITQKLTYANSFQ